MFEKPRPSCSVISAMSEISEVHTTRWGNQLLCITKIVCCLLLQHDFLKWQRSIVLCNVRRLIVFGSVYNNFETRSTSVPLSLQGVGHRIQKLNFLFKCILQAYIDFILKIIDNKLMPFNMNSSLLSKLEQRNRFDFNCFLITQNHTQ